MKTGNTTPHDFTPLDAAVQAGELELHAFGSHNRSKRKKSPIAGLESFGFWKTQGEQHFGSPPHYNDSVHFMLTLQGQTPAVIDDKAYLLHPGELMVTRPWQKHAVGYPSFSHGRFGWITLDVGIRHPHETWTWPSWVALTRLELKNLTAALRLNEDALRPVSAAFIERFTQLVQLAKEPDVATHHSRIRIYANLMLLELHESFCTTQATTVYSEALTDTARTIQLFLEKLPAQLQLPWSVERMAEACGISVTGFARQFIMQTGETPAKYLLRLRMEQSLKLLRDEHLSVKAICDQIGFGGVSPFIQQFAKRYGCTPHAWRKRV